MANSGTVRRAVEAVLAEPPALVLLLGNFTCYPGKRQYRDIAELIGILHPLPTAGLSVYAVLANHDYAATSLQAPKNETLAAHVRQALEAIGIRVPIDEAVALHPPGLQHEPLIEAPPDELLYMVGIGSDAARLAAPARAVSQAPDSAARLVLFGQRYLNKSAQ